ncbi:hypothetical protein [Haloplanus rubicundus]
MFGSVAQKVTRQSPVPVHSVSVGCDW